MAKLSRRDEWNAAKAGGLGRFVVTGALRRGIPMSLAVLVLLEVIDGPGFSRDRLLSTDFALRVLFVCSVFLVGGAISAFARWKSFQALYDDDSST